MEGQDTTEGILDPKIYFEESFGLTSIVEDESAPPSSWSQDPTITWPETRLPSSFNNRNGQGALHIAVAADNEELIKVLLDYGADVLKQDLDGNTALHIAAARGSEVALKLLLEASTKTDVTNIWGRTALLVAVENGHEDIVFALLRGGFDADVTDALGNTALHLAAEKGFVQIAKCLLQNGANINA